MQAVVSTYFRKIAFPFEGGITVVDQQNFLPNGSQVTGSVPMIHGSDRSIQDIGVGLLKDPTMMGTFALPSPICIGNVPFVATCNMVSTLKATEGRVAMDHAMVLPPSPIEIL